MHSILTAIALMMVFEGILPFVNPQLWRAAAYNGSFGHW